MKPSISIIIPCYNSDQWLEVAVRSCLKQNIGEYEIIIIDDGSTDSTQAVIAKMKDEFPENIKCYLQERRGANVARNLGIRNAAANYLVFLDSDDAFCSGALQSLMAYMGGADICFGDTEHIDPNGNVINRPIRKSLSGDPLVDFLRGTPFTPSIIFKKFVFSDTLWDEKLPCSQEYDLMIRMAMKGHKFKYAPVIVARVMHHRRIHRIANSQKYRRPFVRGELLRAYEKSLCQPGMRTRKRWIALQEMLIAAAVAQRRVSNEEPEKKKARELLAGARNQLLKVLHLPIMPDIITLAFWTGLESSIKIQDIWTQAKLKLRALLENYSRHS